MLRYSLTESSFKLLHRCVTIATWVVLLTLLRFTYLNYYLKLILYSLLIITTWITFLESWYREDATRVVLRVVVRIYSMIILEIVNRIATEVLWGVFQQGLSLDSFKNSFVGDFATLALRPSLELLATHPRAILRYRYLLQF